jgi:hypothetical protein
MKHSTPITETFESPGTGEPQDKACVTAGRLDQACLVARILEGMPDVLGNIRQGVSSLVTKSRSSRWAVRDLMRPERVPSRQQQAVSFEDGQAIQPDAQVVGGSSSRLTGQPSSARRRQAIRLHTN